MFRSLILLLAAAPLMAQAPKGPEFSEKVLPFLDDQTLFVARVDLSRVQLEPFVGLLATLQGDEEELAVGVKEIKAWLGEFVRKGGRDVFVTYGANDFPNIPCLLIPISESPEQRKDLGELLKAPFGDDDEMLIEKLHGCMVVGRKTSVAALKTRKPVKRFDLLEALESGKEEPIQVALSFSEDARKIHEQVAPTLPAELGGGSITRFTRGAKWVSLTVGPAPTLLARWTIQATSPEALKDIAASQEQFRKYLAEEIAGKLPEPVAAFRPQIQKAFATIVMKSEGSRQIVEWELGPILREFKKELPAATAADRLRSSNNLKQLVLALHNFHDAHGSFPTDIRDKNGKALLSWRVHLLPYLEQANLYQQFKLTEPWDSDNNKRLAETAVKVFMSPAQKGAKNLTTYLAPLGQGYAWDRPKGLKIADVTDGTSNTILLLEADDEAAVVWSKPGDLKIDPSKPLKNLLGHYGEGFNAAFADGSVRYFKKTITPENLIALLTRAGGEVIPEDVTKPLNVKNNLPVKK